MSVVANIRYPQKTVERTDYGPVFSGMVPAVLLAAIMIKFSAISAPGLRIQVSAWTFSMLVCWFALAKGVFLHAHRAQTAKGRAAANQAFAIWIRSRAGRCAGFAACTLVVAAGYDLALRYNAAMSPDAVAA